MITINGNEYRNLEEQVQANKNDIARIIEGEELLARLGIKVVGQVATAEDLPNPATYAGEFGDAYLIGAESPYNYYIFTRPFEGEENPQWFNLGPFPVAGPKGETGAAGPVGPTGKRGSQWFSGNTDPSTLSGYEIGDVYFNTITGYIWHLHDVGGVGRWLREANIIGPQGPVGPQGPTGPIGEPGPQGPQGPQGPAGRTVSIKGEVVNVDDLPDPNTVDRDSAYLMPSGSVKYLYIISENYNGLIWYNAGPFNAGTAITVGGEYVNEWNADTKLTTGASMTYSLGQGLRLYKMDGNNRTSSYASLRQDGIIDVRDSTKSTQLGIASMTVNGGGTGNSTRYSVNEILTKPTGATSWNTVKLPNKSGALATTSDITSYIESLVPGIINTNITSISKWYAAGDVNGSFFPQPGKGYIVVMRANSDTGKIVYRGVQASGAEDTLEAQMIIAFIPKEPYQTNVYDDDTGSYIKVMRPWVITIDKGTLIPSIDASTFNVKANDLQIFMTLTPKNYNTAVDKFVMTY